MSHIEINTSELREFFTTVEKAARGGFRKDMEMFLEGVGNEFLRLVEDEIIRREVMDTRLLLASFHKGNENNVWEITEGGLTLEVGSTVNYAKYANDGHWTNKKGVERRFVPGYWEGDRFIYDRNADGGMVLTQKWVEGKHYFDSALLILEKIFPDMLASKLQDWLDNYF